MQNWHCVVIEDFNIKTRFADLFRKGWEAYANLPTAVGNIKFDDPKPKSYSIESYIICKILGRAFKGSSNSCISCVAARDDQGQSVAAQCAVWGSIGPAVWSFILTARLFGLDMTWIIFSSIV